MDDIPCRQTPCAGDHRFADLTPANTLAFLLNSRAALIVDRAGNASTQDQVAVGRIDDGIDSLIGDISLNDLDNRVVDPGLHDSTSCL